MRDLRPHRPLKQDLPEGEGGAPVGEDEGGDRLVWTSVAMLALLVIILIAALMLLPDSAEHGKSILFRLMMVSENDN